MSKDQSRTAENPRRSRGPYTDEFIEQTKVIQGKSDKPQELTARQRVRERMRSLPDVLALLHSDAAKPLVQPPQDAKDDLWQAVRHFMTTTRAEGMADFPDAIAAAIRQALVLEPSDPIPASRLHEVSDLIFKRGTVANWHLAHLARLPGLQTLVLAETEVTDAGLAHLTPLSGLRQLMLKRVPVTDKGLALLKVLTSLRVLWLSETKVTNDGLAHLKDLAGLQTLALDGTQVTNEGLAHLKTLTGLRNLSIGDTQVTEAGVADLKKALPHLVVHGERRQD